MKKRKDEEKAWSQITTNRDQQNRLIFYALVLNKLNYIILKNVKPH